MSMNNRSRFNASDRETVAGLAAIGPFDRVEFQSDEGADMAAIYLKGAAPGDEPAFVVTKQTMDGVYLLTRGFRVLAAGDNLKAVVAPLQPRGRKPRAAKIAA